MSPEHLALILQCDHILYHNHNVSYTYVPHMAWIQSLRQELHIDRHGSNFAELYSQLRSFPVYFFRNHFFYDWNLWKGVVFEDILGSITIITWQFHGIPMVQELPWDLLPCHAVRKETSQQQGVPRASIQNCDILRLRERKRQKKPLLEDTWLCIKTLAALDVHVPKWSKMYVPAKIRRIGAGAKWSKPTV